MKHLSLRVMTSFLFVLIATHAWSQTLYHRTADGSWVQPPECTAGVFAKCLGQAHKSCLRRIISGVKIVEADGMEEVLDCAQLQEKIRPREIPLAELIPAGAVPVTDSLLLINVLRIAPDFFTETEWVAMTERQIAWDQQNHASQHPAPGFQPIFTQEQVHERNAKIASAELMPLFRAEALKRAATASRQLVVSTPVRLSRYDTEAQVLTIQCCPAAGDPANRFALLQLHSEALHGRPIAGLATPAPLKATYGIEDNQIKSNTLEAPPAVPGISAISRQAQSMALVLDRRVALDGVPLEQREAEALLNKRHDLKLNSLVVFEVTGIERGDFYVAVHGRLVSAGIASPAGMLASYPANSFPIAEVAVVEPEPAPAEEDTYAAARQRLDVVGIRLGMSAGEVDKVIRAHMPVGWLYQRQRDAAEEPKPHQNVKLYMSKDLTEGISIYLEPAIDGSVVAIRRQSFIGQLPPPVEVVGTELEKKYGPASGGGNGNWFWGGGGCVPAGTGGWNQRNLELIEGAALDDQTFARSVSHVLDLMSHDRYEAARYTQRFGTCEPKLMVLRGARSIMTTLVDQRAAIIEPAVNHAKPTF